MRERIKVKSNLVGSSDNKRIHAAKAVREYNHKAFMAVGTQVKVDADLEVIKVDRVKRNNKPLYTTITFWGGITMTVPTEIAEKANFVK